jgi:hypothetical protein
MLRVPGKPDPRKWTVFRLLIRCPEIGTVTAMNQVGIASALRQLGAHTEDPRWSSAVLEGLIDAAAAAPAGRVTDLLCVLCDLLGEVSTIGDATAHLVKDIVVGAFTRQRRSYDAGDLSPIARRVADGDRPPTPAQAYLALLALPEALLAPCRDAILGALDGTDRGTEARRLLDDGA